MGKRCRSRTALGRATKCMISRATTFAEQVVEDAFISVRRACRVLRKVSRSRAGAGRASKQVVYLNVCLSRLVVSWVGSSSLGGRTRRCRCCLDAVCVMCRLRLSLRAVGPFPGVGVFSRKCVPKTAFRSDVHL